MNAALANPTLAKPIAGEDLRVGDYVAVLDQAIEFPSFLWACDASLLPADKPVRVTVRSLERGRPLKVKAVCLPYVLVRTPCGRARTIDIAMCRLVRLDPAFAKQVRRACGGKRKRKKRR